MFLNCNGFNLKVGDYMTRRWYKHILALAAICMLFSGLTTAYAGNTTEFMDGNGTAEDPYLISNTTHLLNAHLYPQAHFLLMKDLKIIYMPLIKME